MNIKNFIKKQLKKDTSNIRFLVKLIGINTNETKWFNLDSLVKYLTKNEFRIAKMNIKLIENIKEVN